MRSSYACVHDGVHLAFFVECNEFVLQGLVIVGDEVDCLLAVLLQAMLQILL